MGSYLRLATETVCRVLTRFEQKGWLVSRDKRLDLTDVDALREIAEPVGLHEAA
jgi:CRP/FNR family transcriptional regulator